MSTPRDAVADCLSSVTDGTLSPRARRVVTVGIGVCVSPTLIPVLTESSLPAWARVVDLVVAVASVVIAAVVLYRRPVGTAVAMSLVATVSPAATPLATAALIVVAIRYRLRLGLPIAALGIAAHALLRMFRPIESLGMGWWLLLVVAVYAALLGISLALANYLALVRSLRDRAERAETEQEWRVTEARRTERDQIARDMHDVLAHRLSLLATYAGALEYRPDASPDRLASAAAVVRDGVHRALEEIRDIIGVLRYDDGDDPDVDRAPRMGMTDLRALVDETRAAGTQVDIATDLDGTPPTALDCTAYRVAQEAMTNARKHAPGAPISLRVAGRPGDMLTLELENATCPGATGDVASLGAGTGLVGLAERAATVGGRFSHDVTDDGRFCVRLEAPWPV